MSTCVCSPGTYGPEGTKGGSTDRTLRGPSHATDCPMFSTGQEAAPLPVTDQQSAEVEAKPDALSILRSGIALAGLTYLEPSLDALAQRIETMTNKLNEDSQNFQILCQKEEIALLEARVKTLTRERDEALAQIDAVTERIELRADEDNIYRVYDAAVEERQRAEAQRDRLIEELEELKRERS